MEVVEKTLWCDICEAEIDVDKNLGVDETRITALVNISVDVYYNGIFSPEHICIDCQESILSHIKKIRECNILTQNWRKRT